VTVDKQEFHRKRLILDSECMIPDDQGVTEEWILRVDGREYGPANIETLREWKAEGRVLPANEARRADTDLWNLAAEIPGLFISPPPLPIDRDEYRRRYCGVGEVFRETFRIYRKGFLQFFCFSLVQAVPAFFLQLALPKLDLGSQTAPNWEAIRPNSFSLSMLVLFAFLWPVFLAGIQLISADVLDGRKPRLGILFGRSLRLWPRMAGLSLLVYGSYFVWSAVPLVVAFGLLVSEPSILAVLLAMLLLTFQVYMTARLWVNFMFWQQSAALGQLSGLAALRESKALARSRRSEPWLDRPVYRGAIIVSIWIIVALVVSTAVQLPFVLLQLRGVTLEQMQTVLQNLGSSPTPQPLLLAAYITSALVHAAIRPLLGIAFVLLYLDSKVEMPSHMTPIAGTDEGDAVS
jgi:hypothetical protein